MARGSKTTGARRTSKGPAAPNTFGPDWLATQLTALVPGFPHTPLCVALSGGVDSTALLTALAAIHPRLGALRALHVDHGLRPAARQWAQQCRDLARRLHVPLQVLTAKVVRSAGTSLEAAARDARYVLLAAALKPGEALLLAHHADDQLETVLLQLLRGSGLPGLAAMPAAAPFATGTLVRPLLSRSRQELEAWARGQSITWVEDDSNADESLNRNYLRRRILPLIHARWPGSAAAVARSARHVAEAQSLLARLALTDLERASYGESLSVKALRALPADRLNNALRFWITRAGLRAPDTRRLAEISGPLLNAREDANPFVEWGEEGARVQRQGDLLSLSRRDEAAARARHHGDLPSTPRRDESNARTRHHGDSPSTSRRNEANARARHHGDLPSTSRRNEANARARHHGDLPSTSRRNNPRAGRAPHSSSAGASVPAPLSPADSPRHLIWSWRDSSKCDLPRDLGKLQLEPDVHGPIDLDALPHPLTVRWRRGGERLAPRRGGPHRALKSLLQESQVPVSERLRLPLLFAATPGGEKLLAVADLLLDEAVQSTSTTRRRARLRWVKSPR